ncbi:MAG: hypothetical protein IKA19_03160 [Muribaculaceae bacterium]|nr:hypothetical protein [Muribaculaceae bacterium]MBR1963686.1 hypothetical protein [Muribaculaceae bacterium]
MKKHLLILVTIFLPLLLSAQAKKPTIMVIPADVWCTANGYMMEFENQGVTSRIPDYHRAVQEDMDLVNTITKVGELMAERGLPLKDLASSIRSINQANAENEMTVSRTSGSSISETPLDKLLSRAKADILVELSWKINTVGPKNSVTYTLRGIDAYTNKQVAAAQGTGAASFSAEVPVLIEEAVLQHMDNFISQLQAHFDDLLTNGREITFEVRTFDNGSGASLEDEYSGQELTEIIDEWVAQNTVEHRYNLTDATEDMMIFEQVRIPLYRPNGMPMDTRHFANELRKYLKKAPFNLTSKVLTKGLGKAIVVIGEK